MKEGIGVPRWLGCVAAAAVAFSQGADGRAGELEAGWGIDAILTCAVKPEAVPEWLSLVKRSDVTFLRERWTTTHSLNPSQPDFRPVYAMEKAAGFHVVAFGRDMAALPGVEKPGGASRDLRSVYEEGRRIGREFAGFVDVWELHNEPDVGYMPELPDRYTSHVKALYLGLKAGGRERGVDTPVLLGALALPPGPWLERAARNGVLDYADGYNFHYYGNANEFTSVIDAHRVAQRELGNLGHGDFAVNTSARRPSTLRGPGAGFGRKLEWQPMGARVMPMWITECGVRANPTEQFFDETRRAHQAEFTLSTAAQALAAPDVAVFMPFILVHKGDPHALVVQENLAPFRGWDAYAQFTKENPWPKRPLFDVAGERASPVVLQWLPAPNTPDHKVAGCYRITGPNPIDGEFRVFNFGDKPVSGRLDLDAGLSSLRLVADTPGRRPSWQLTVPPGGHVAVPVSYASKFTGGYFREWTSARFRDEAGRVSQVRFGIERDPDSRDFDFRPLALRRIDGPGGPQVPSVNVEGVALGAWRVFNGLAVESLSPMATRFSVTTSVNDPLAPTYAMAALSGGIPRGAKFLRMKLDRPMSNDTLVRVDLIENDGQRFTIWENLGNVFQAFSREVWLGLEDFHPYLWSKAVPGRRLLRPAAVREIHLRFYLPHGASMDVELEWAVARR